MQFDLVISDMDGTLLRVDKTISERSLRAIRRFEEAGGRFTIATGRCLQGVSRYLGALGLRTPLILQNGCLVHDPVSGEDLLCRQLPGEALAQVWPVLREAGLDLVVYGPRRAVTLAINDVVAAHQRHDGIEIDVAPDLCPESAGMVVKVLAIGDPGLLDEVERAIEALAMRVRLVRSYPHYLEVLPVEGGKGSAVEALLRHLGVPRRRALAIGDGLNDLDLLAAAGTGVAMGNAHPAVKQAAAHLTATNMEDGVAEVLEALVAGRGVGMARLA